MKNTYKIFKSILFYTLLYWLFYFIIGKILDANNLVYLEYFKLFSICIISLGILLGTIQFVNNSTNEGKTKIVLYTLFLIIEIIIIGIVLFSHLLFSDEEKIVYIDNEKMIESRHSFLLGNWINYYDYKNIFYRSKQLKISMNYDDTLGDGDYLYTNYYDEKGNVIKKEEAKITDCEDRNWVRGQSKMCQFKDVENLLNNEEKILITNRLNGLDIFNNTSIAIDNYSIIGITYDNSDYDAFGTITLFINSSFDELKELLVQTNNYRISTNENTDITLTDEIGTISFYKDNDGKSVLVLKSELPYRYKIGEINNYGEFKQYFLNLNEENIKKSD